MILNDKSLNAYSAHYINATLQSRKRLLQGDILLGRGAYAASKNLLLQVISTTKKFSLHNERFQAEFLLHRNQSINMSVREFQKRSRNLIELNHQTYLINKAAILHYSLTNIFINQTIDDEERLQKIREEIREIESIANDTSSPMAHYYFLLTNILFLQYTNKYKEAYEYCLKYLTLVRDEPSVNSQQRLANAHFQLAEVCLHMADMDQANEYINKTLDFFSKEEMNYLIVLGSAFRIAFFSEDFQKAATLYDQAAGHPRFNVSKMRAAQWHYFNACLLFKKGDIKNAMMELNDSTALLSDKMGWNISFRLLEIMILFEANHLDLLDTKILNMRQFVKRTHRKSDLYRHMILISILMDWHKNNLDIRKNLSRNTKAPEKTEQFSRRIPFQSNSNRINPT